MQVTPSGKRPCPTPPTPNAPDLESARFANRDTVVLPDEMVIKILMNLGTTDIAVCRSVNRQWQTLIDTSHLLARSFYRDCHLTQRINSPAAQRNLAVERYHSHIRGWLTDFGNRGRETAEQLDNILGDVHFPKVLFFSIRKLLLTSKELTYQNTATIGYSGVVNNVSFSPDGKYLVTACGDNNVRLWEPEGGQWREKAILDGPCVSALVKTSFSPDGKYVLTVSNYNYATLWERVDGQWRGKVTLRHSARPMFWASFNPDGNHLVTLSSDSICKIWRLKDDQWQEKATIKHSGLSFINAQFSPDGKHLVIASHEGTVKIWKLENGQWEEKFTIEHPYRVTNSCFSPDGKHLVTVISDGLALGEFIHYAKLWELVDDQSQENETIQRWQEKATIEYSEVVNDANFSPDGKHFVLASYDKTAKICGLEGGKWQVKATIRHSGSVANASFSRNGKLLVTTSYDGVNKICRLVGDKWQKIFTIRHSTRMIDARFGPEDYQLVTACCDNTTKIWVLKNKENNGNSWIRNKLLKIKKHTIKKK